jgi:hypothetical protein
MDNILLVTKYPPTTLIVAKKTAAVPNSTVIVKELLDPEDNKAPTKVIPDIAFAPDINGVCNVEGTFEINSIPKKIESTNTNTSKIIDSIIFKILSKVY